MDQDLVGYLLDALDPEATAAVERHLESSPEARKKLQQLRRALLPLSNDSEDPSPPPNLVWNTLRRIAAEPPPTRRTDSRPPTLRLPPARASVPSRWRRANVLVAASIILLGLLLIPPAVLHLRHEQYKLECRSNLSHLHQALMTYAADHQQKLPGPDADGPLARAGAYAVKLQQAGLKGLHVNCPASGRKCPSTPPTSDELKEKHGTPEYLDAARAMGGCYGYHLGYMDDQRQLRPLTLVDDKRIPVMADRPPRPEEGVGWNTRNSPNHGNEGQNVLHLGGDVQFLKSRMSGDDDIFLNHRRRPAAGFSPYDAVLAPSETHPLGR